MCQPHFSADPRPAAASLSGSFYLPRSFCAASALITSSAETVNRVELCGAFSRWIYAGNPVFSFFLNAEIPSVSSALRCGSIMDGVWYKHRRKSISSAGSFQRRQLLVEVSPLFFFFSFVLL